MSSSVNCEISSEIRNLVIRNYKEGKRISDIASMFNVNCNSVKTIIKRYKDRGTLEIKVRSGRLQKVILRRERLIIREMKKDRKVKLQNLANTINEEESIKISNRTLKRVLNKNGYNKRIARKKPFISIKNKKSREKWAKDHLNWSLFKWKQLLWADECHIEHDCQRNVLVWRRAGEEWLTDCMQDTFKSSRISITIWGCI